MKPFVIHGKIVSVRFVRLVADLLEHVSHLLIITINVIADAIGACQGR